MKRLMIALILILLLAACGNDLGENEIKLAEDKNVKMVAEIMEREIEGESRKSISVVELTNKTDRTFKLNTTGFEVDGVDVHYFDMIDTPEELEADSTGYIIVSAFIKEHLKGSIDYEDYEGNKHTVQFSEYID